MRLGFPPGHDERKRPSKGLSQALKVGFLLLRAGGERQGRLPSEPGSGEEITTDREVITAQLSSLFSVGGRCAKCATGDGTDDTWLEVVLVGWRKEK